MNDENLNLHIRTPRKSVKSLGSRMKTLFFIGLLLSTLMLGLWLIKLFGLVGLTGDFGLAAIIIAAAGLIYVVYRLVPKRAAIPVEETEPKPKPAVQLAAKHEVPAWQQVLTASLKANALAPSEEVILHAYDLYCEELNGPFNERRRLMSERFSNIASGFARIQSLAPDMVERAAAKHRLELNRFVDHKGDF
ncbi:hypothetical protein [Dinoroseobacter sp. S124A]|uniref:hypothetical protein n=1 Tax=Dinoroseobacter sp. S124A TaxID=3415128 RepID=UPI003C7C69F9